MAVSCIISDSETLVENRDSFIPPLHSTPPLEGLRPNIAMTFGAVITSMVCLPDCGYRIPACDRQTDRQTYCDSIVRAMHGIAR